jgi:kynurenine formamidase
MADFFEGLDKSELPDSEGWAIEMVQLCTHNGTHLDAPYHYHSTMNNKAGGSERAITIDEVPLEWCFQPGVKLDFRDKPDGYVVTAADVEAELARIEVDLAPLTIVLVNTSAGKRYGSEDYVNAGAGMGYEATMYLLERGIRVTGTDAWSWDAPLVIPLSATPPTKTRVLFGRGTRPDVILATAISRRCTTWRCCPTMASPSAAFLIKSAVARPGGREQWRLSMRLNLLS